MKKTTMILILSITLPALAFIAFYFITKSYHSDGNTYTNLEKKTTKGICYFDIDGTLITAKGNRDEMMKQCLDNNFAIGIITASNRRIEDVCDGSKAKESWMSDLLCKQFNENGGKMYNSTRVVAGKTVFPDSYPHNKDQGYIKAFDMAYGRDKFYPHIPDKCVVLFDDQQPVLDGVHSFGSNFETQCANHPHVGDRTTCTTLGRPLDVSAVKSKIEYMKANGCV